MKKKIALLLAPFMAFALAACGRSSAPAAEETPAPEGPAEGPGDGEAGKTLTVGKISGNTCTSDMFGMSYTIGDGWRFFTPEEVSGLGIGVLNGALNENTGSAILLTVYPSDTYHATGSEIAAEDYSLYVQSRESYLRSAGLGADTEVSLKTYRISGEDHDGLLFETGANGASMSFITLYRVYTDRDTEVTHVMDIALSSHSAGELDQMLGMLSFQPEEY